MPTKIKSDHYDSRWLAGYAMVGLIDIVKAAEAARHYVAAGAERRRPVEVANSTTPGCLPHAFREAMILQGKRF